MALQVEQDLGSSLARFLGVRPPKRIPDPFVDGAFIEALELWPAGSAASYSIAAAQGHMAAAERGSSENYVLLALACGVAAKVPGADALAIAWLSTLKSRRGWMGNEVGSRDGGYWYFFLDSVCALARWGSPALQALAWEWLDLVRFWAWTGAPMTGQRSVLPGLDVWTICDDTMEYIGGGGAGVVPAPPTFDRLMVRAVLSEIDRLRLRPLANPSWKMATPVTFYVGSSEAMVVLDASTDSNTIACLAGKRKLGTQQRVWAPAPPWGVVEKGGEVVRIREQSDGARCVVSAGAAHYTSRIFKPVNMLLPNDYKVYRLGSGSIQPDGAAGVTNSASIGNSGTGGPGNPYPLGTGGLGPQNIIAAKPSLAQRLGCLVPILLSAGALAALAWAAVERWS